MKYKTRVLVERFSEILASWPGVECVTLNEAALPDTLDPYYALILDVFFSGPIPEADERCEAFGADVIAFESQGVNEKDRFLIGDIPVRLEYKQTAKIDELVLIADSAPDSLWLIKHSGTYGFYRLANGEILFSRSGWMDGIRGRLGALPEVFWNEMRMAAQSKMEHFLSDLGAAAFQGDEFHCLVSSAGFIKTACLALFCVNRRFEPSHRAYYKQALELPSLPDRFSAQLENFFSAGPGDSMDRRFGIAKLLAMGIVRL
ncbi:MAG: DUF4037 domain-containing protein [Treponema sp.]|nr:DUF4037 domain-containing protein [Treponema sp.]